MKIAKIAPSCIKEDATFMDDSTPDEERASQYRESVPNVRWMWWHRIPMANIFASLVHHDRTSQQYLDLGMLNKEIMDRFERPGQILFVAVEVGEDVPLCAAIAPVPFRISNSAPSTSSLIKSGWGIS